MANRRSNLKLFLDSSVLFSAVYSPIDGSAKLFSFKNVTLCVSKIVLHEVEKNTRQKLDNLHLRRFFMLVKHLHIINKYPNDMEIQNAQKVIVEKDAIILSEAKLSKCNYLITLDKRDFLQEKVRDYLRPQQILTPKMFFELHPN